MKHSGVDGPAEGPQGFGSFEATLRRPDRVEKLPPCRAGCPSGTDIRGWISWIAQREKLGLTQDQACEKAWRTLVEYNPFPAVMGRVCPHPCEASCNREEKDGAVAINAMERFIGDWAIEKGLAFSRLEEDDKPESIGVIGSGPAGLSFAYQMARRGYRVTVHEKLEKAGGMLYYGIPAYRLPEEVLEAEIQRIVDLGVELRLGSEIGDDVSSDDFRAQHDVLFLGIGAHTGRRLGIPGEEGPGVWTGVDYLNRLNRGESVTLGKSIAVIGGGNTAVDAARAARRSGAAVTILYRRTRREMPAIEIEIEDAIKEGVTIEFLVAPASVVRDGDRISALALRRMRLGEPDGSGRQRPVPIEGSEFELTVDSIITAVSQEPDWARLDGLRPGGAWVNAGDSGEVAEYVWAGGDVRGLGLASLAVGQGRRAAEHVHARLRGLPPPDAGAGKPVSGDRIRLECYDEKAALVPPERPVEEWLAKPEEEIRLTIGEGEFLSEAGRCFSCGSCFGCEYCYMYCNPAGIMRLEEVRPGAYFIADLDRCEGCGKCIEVCPCGFLDVR